MPDMVVSFSTSNVSKIGQVDGSLGAIPRTEIIIVLCALVSRSLKDFFMCLIRLVNSVTMTLDFPTKFFFEIVPDHS